MPRYASRYKTAYRDTDDFWVHTQFHQNVQKSTEYYPNQILFKKYKHFIPDI